MHEKGSHRTEGELRMTTLRQRLAKARQVLRKHVAQTTALADELIAERREAARRE